MKLLLGWAPKPNLKYPARAIGALRFLTQKGLANSGQVLLDTRLYTSSTLSTRSE